MSRMTEQQRGVPPRDRGAALPLMLVFIVVVSLVTVPLLQYAVTVLAANDGVSEKDARIEAVKGGLRTALADPVGLYQTCSNAGLNVGVDLASPGLDIPVSTECFLIEQTLAEDPTELRYGNVVTRKGQTVPGVATGSVYPGSGGDPANAWHVDATVDPELEKVWMPNLPVHALDRRGTSGYQMESGFPTCNVFFPGTYVDPLTISGEAFFTSGVYYFENTLTFASGADVVWGNGSTQGCTTDQDAAFYTLNGPTLHNMSGLGATIVLGKEGRIVFDDHSSGSSPISVVFNQRYVDPADEANLPSAGVSIMTVNGDPTGATNLVVVDELDVPLSQVGPAASPTPAIDQEYSPSTLTLDDLLVEPDPVIEVDVQANAESNVVIPGYVSVPQGTVSIEGHASNPQSVSITGGVLAAQVDLGTHLPTNLELGLVNPVVQKVFRIYSTSAGITSDAVVQINENGAYAINSWEVQ